jgi:6-phosphogluconolactonase
MKTAPQIAVVPDPAALAQEAARRFTRLAKEAVENRGHFSAALSGGSTPGRLYRRLAEDPHREEMPWEYVHLFWGDERCVAPEHPGSNFRLANEALISHVPIPPGNVHRVRGELEPEAAAQTYATELHAFFGAPWPAFDLVLLGLGQDGHTASLFPGSDVLDEKVRSAVAVTAQYEDRPAQRVTLTLPAINAARHVLFLVSGSGKAEVVQAVLEGPTEGFPAQQIRPTTGQLGWLMDAAAASRLTSP